MRTATIVIVLVMLGGCTLREQASPAAPANSSTPVPPPASAASHPLPPWASPRTSGIPLFDVFHERYHRAANGSWELVFPRFSPEHSCGNGFVLDAGNWTIVAYGTNVSGSMPVAAVDSDPPVDYSWDRSLGFATELPATLWWGSFGDHLFQLNFTSNGTWFDGMRIQPGESVERTIEHNDTREVLTVRHEGLWLPPPGSHQEWGCD